MQGSSKWNPEPAGVSEEKCVLRGSLLSLFPSRTQESGGAGGES